MKSSRNFDEQSLCGQPEQAKKAGQGSRAAGQGPARRRASRCWVSRRRSGRGAAVLATLLLAASGWAAEPSAAVAPEAGKEAAQDGAAEVVAVQKIWDQGEHNAFTDLIRFKDRWYCVFREGAGHVSPDGALRVLRSEDAKTWTSAALVRSDIGDLRDAKISITPQGKLMLLGAVALPPPSEIRHQSLVWFSDDGENWGDAVEIGEPNFWIWRVTWHQGKAYGIGYATGSQSRQDRSVRLYKSDDGRKFDVLVENLLDVGYPNETALVFLEDNTALCVLRRDGDPNEALLGKAQPPYTDWTWQGLGRRIGGPAMLQLPDGRLLVAGREYVGGATTRLWWLDPEKPTLQEAAHLPSGGDTSYPGLVWHDQRLWVSYYSSHEGKTNIYLAELQLPAAAP